MVILLKKIIFISWCLISIFTSTAQTGKWISFQFASPVHSLQKAYSAYRFTDSLQINNQINEVLFSCYELGYLMAQDSLVVELTDSMIVNIRLGNLYKVKGINIGNVPVEWVGNFGNKYLQTQNRDFKPKEIALWMKQH